MRVSRSEQVARDARIAMRLTSLKIENFRSIKSVEVPLGETTVFIGPNNSGKTSLLDAVRIALTRKWGQRGTGFTEYDVRLAHENDDPKTSPAVAIEIRAEESAANEWPDELHQALADILQDDPVTGRSSVTLRVSCGWSAAQGSYEPTWTFLNAARLPLVGGSARRVNLERFWQYLPVFYLGALRDAQDEFSTRSQFWGRLLKAMEIPAALEGRVQRVLDLLNKKLLRADARLTKIADVLAGATQIAARDRDGGVNLRLVPLKSWDLLSKAEIILRNEPDWPWLPLNKHGQGVQSLTVIFLFQAFVEHLLTELYEPDSTPILALEEPETHLHPQAARTLWSHVTKLSGQKLITTHSPYFVQHVPFRDIRLVRLGERGTEIHWLPSTFSTYAPELTELLDVVQKSPDVLRFDSPTQTLTVAGCLEEPLYRELLTVYGAHPERAHIHRDLRDLRDRSRLFMTDHDLRALETYARRIRGEILFAQRWLIVEGQAEYLLIHSMARALSYDLDAHGVSVIDAANNGNPAIFAALARALGIPWIAVFDGDSAGHGFVASISARHFDTKEVSERCATLPDGNLEEQLLADGLEYELRSSLQACGFPDALTIPQGEIKGALDENKTRYSAALAAQIDLDPALGQRMPEAFRNALNALRGLT
ncbi:MAG: putative ATP-dependent endonuclease of the family [Thermoanaerobaculia bacterium]|nr:putative ATP-dependent endonuclease of the family [Thermoanaerobaculia bacterium]